MFPFPFSIFILIKESRARPNRLTSLHLLTSVSYGLNLYLPSLPIVYSEFLLISINTVLLTYRMPLTNSTSLRSHTCPTATCICTKTSYVRTGHPAGFLTSCLSPIGSASMSTSKFTSLSLPLGVSSHLPLNPISSVGDSPLLLYPLHPSPVHSPLLTFPPSLPTHSSATASPIEPCFQSLSLLSCRPYRPPLHSIQCIGRLDPRSILGYRAFVHFRLGWTYDAFDKH